MIKGQKISKWVFVALISVFLFGCSDTKKRSSRNRGVEKLDVISIRVDDDAEYHLMAYSHKTGQVETWSDLDELNITYKSSGKAEGLINTEDVGNGHFTRENPNFYPIKITIPRDFKIETFDD
jgi:hypothetical protein